VKHKGRPRLKQTGQWARIIETNVIGLIRVTRKLITSMVERDFGHIVNIGSIAGLQSYATGSNYSGSKHAVYGSAKPCALTMRTPAFG
jgi:hypothetical protein